jgi:hypothetical protein
MAAPPADEPIRHAVTVPVPAGQAFAAFVDLARWWPREYTWAAGTLEDIGIASQREGGLCYERGPHGFTCHWAGSWPGDPPATATPPFPTTRPWPPRRAGRSSSTATPTEQAPRTPCCKLDRSSRAWRNRQTRRV